MLAKVNRFSFEAIGTKWHIDTSQGLNTKIKSLILKRINAYDKNFSRFKDNSLVRRISEQAGTFEFPGEATELISFYRELYDATNGLVTPLIGQMLESAGYDQSYSFKPRQQTRVARWDEAMSWEGTVLNTQFPILLDFGAAGKGQLVDIISQLLASNGFESFVIDASGDMYCQNMGTQVVGLENPWSDDEVIGTAHIEGGGLCASAINRRKWGNNMHHVFNPQNLAPQRGVEATWVTAETTMIADGIATALFFASPAELSLQYKYEYVRIMSDGSIEWSKNWQGDIY